MIRILLLTTLLTLGWQPPLQSQATSEKTKPGTSSALQKSGNQLHPATTDEPRVLQPGSLKSLAVPPFSRFGESKCDSTGDMYFAVGGNTHNLGSLRKISHDGSDNTAFAPPTPEKLDPLGEIGYRDFAVTPSGRVYELLENRNDRGIVVVAFDSDGSVRHTIKLEAPEMLGARSLAVFDDGTVLLQGFIRLKAGEEAARGYVALFDASGKLRAELTDFPEVDLAALGRALQDGGIAIGQDGNAYALDPNFISVISESGVTIRHMPYRKPDPALVARGLTLSDGLIAMRVLQVRGVEITVKYLVVRADDGETVGYYTLPDETDAPGMCFSRMDGFTFLTLRDMKLALVNAPLR